MEGDVQGRVERLERRVRVMTGLVGLLVASLGMVALAAAAKPRPAFLEAGVFHIVDEKGKAWGAFGTKGGGSFLTLSGPDGKERITLGITEDGSTMAGITGIGKSEAALVAPKGEAPFLDITDRDGAEVFRKP